MKLIVAILIALGLGWLLDAFRRKSVSAPGLDGGARSPDEPLSARIADTADAAMGAAAGIGLKAVDTAQRVAPGAAGAVSDSIDKMSGAASAAADKASGVASTAAGKASDVAATAADKLSGPASSAAGKAADVASNAANLASGAATAASARLPGVGSTERAQDATGVAGQVQGQGMTGAGMPRPGAASEQAAGDLTSAQEAFGEPLPATPPAGERPLAAPLRPDEADVRTALAEPTPEAVEVYDEERDAIALRAPEAGTAPGATFGGASAASAPPVSDHARGQAAAGQPHPPASGAGSGTGSMSAGAGTGAAGTATASQPGGATEETRFREAARAGIDVAARDAASGSAGATTTGRMTVVAGSAAAAPPADSVAGDGSYHCPSGYPIKGNASSHIFHMPGSRAYAQTIPEFCFRTAAAAEAAGYRMAKQALEAAGRPDLDVSEGLTGIGQSTGSAAGTKSVPADGTSAMAGASTAGQVGPGHAAERSGVNASTASHGAAGGAPAARTPAGAVGGDGTHRCPNGYPVKGNASSRIYHVPGSSSYEQTIPEFCFDSSASAEAAGFRAPKR